MGWQGWVTLPEQVGCSCLEGKPATVRGKQWLEVEEGLVTNDSSSFSKAFRM